MVKEGSLYRHFKGSIYKVLFIAYDSETSDQVVVYESIDGVRFVRNKKMFESLVDKNKYPDIKQEYRFQLIND